MEYVIIITPTGSIMGRVSKMGEEDMTIRNPRSLYNMQNKTTGEVKLGFLELIGTPVEMTIPAHSFPVYEPLDPEIISGYVKATTGLYSVN